jgi:hypothetical protein
VEHEVCVCVFIYVCVPLPMDRCIVRNLELISNIHTHTHTLTHTQNKASIQGGGCLGHQCCKALRPPDQRRHVPLHLGVSLCVCARVCECMSPPHSHCHSLTHSQTHTHTHTHNQSTNGRVKYPGLVLREILSQASRVGDTVNNTQTISNIKKACVGAPGPNGLQNCETAVFASAQMGTYYPKVKLCVCMYVCVLLGLGIVESVTV